MYDELVKQLRGCAEVNSLSLYKRGLMKQAADAIEELTRENKELSFRSAQLEAMNDALIGETGAADVRPVVSASWEEKEKDGVWWYACSACGEHIPKGRWGQEWHSNFCPNCGARMDGD